MGELGDIMGDDFEEEYKEKRDARRREARKVDKETLMEICYHAINADGFEGEDPRFTFTGGEVEHDVLLMESPDSDMQKFKNEFSNGGMSLGMFHVDTLYSCAFNEDMLDVMEKIEVGEFYIIVGRYEEKKDIDGNGEETTYYNVNPVRGVVPLAVGKKYAEQYESQMDGKPVEEQSQEQNSEVESDDDDSGSVSIGTDVQPTEDVDRSSIIDVFQAVGTQAPDVLEGTAEGDSDMMDRLTEIVDNNTDGNVEHERVLDVFEEEVEEIDGRGEEDDEDSGIDLGGIGSDGDDDDSDSETEDDEASTSEPEPEPDTEDEQTEDVDDEEEDDSGEVNADDWF